jgi:hypothetical protein
MTMIDDDIPLRIWRRASRDQHSKLGFSERECQRNEADNVVWIRWVLGRGWVRDPKPETTQRQINQGSENISSKHVIWKFDVKIIVP